MRIDELQLLAGRLPALHDFYASLLGLPVVSRSEAKVTFQVGDSRLTFAQAPAGWDGSYHFAFNIPANQFPEAKQWLSQRVTLIRDKKRRDTFTFTGWHADAMYFYDPEGNIVELIARHRLGNGISKPFDTQSVLAISEIGFPTDDVKQTVQTLCDRLSARVYDGADSDEFTAVGDEDGLIIVVKQGRLWFPDTGKMARRVPLTVQVRDLAGQRHSVQALWRPSTLLIDESDFTSV
jgi:catechol-2,3-dioxygenase